MAAITVLGGISVETNRVSFAISAKVTRRSAFVCQGCRAMLFCMRHMVKLLRDRRSTEGGHLHPLSLWKLSGRLLHCKVRPCGLAL